MSHAPTPWVGLAALVAMFVIPMLPNWLFEGLRTVRHHPRRHICALCSALWTSHHDCLAELPEVVPSLRGQLRRLDEATTAPKLGSQPPPPPTSPIQISPPGGNQLAQPGSTERWSVEDWVIRKRAL
jgi:hypothetical protein